MFVMLWKSIFIEIKAFFFPISSMTRPNVAGNILPVALKKKPCLSLLIGYFCILYINQSISQSDFIFIPLFIQTLSHKVVCKLNPGNNRYSPAPLPFLPFRTYSQCSLWNICQALKENSLIKWFKKKTENKNRLSGNTVVDEETHEEAE